MIKMIEYKKTCFLFLPHIKDVREPPPKKKRPYNAIKITIHCRAPRHPKSLRRH